MQTRYMERTNSVNGRGKRSLEEGASEEPDRERKRPALASVIVEALKVDSLQRLFSSLEPIIRRVVSEEVERALTKLGPATLAGTGRSSPKRIEGPDGRNLQLQFSTRLSLPLFTGGKVVGELGAAIHVVLRDANTGLVVTSGPESSLKLDVVVLEGDFNNEDADGWTEEEFESHIVKERDGRRPLLTGDLQVTLREGVGTLGENLSFTDNSSWIRSRKFRLGLRAPSEYCKGIRIREARTEAFTVKDHRGELYKKHYPPALNDEVWRLEKIGKDGAFHKKLTAAGINTVEDFLRLAVRDPQKLRTILGSGMSNKMWEVLIEHANTCVLSEKLYLYYQDDTRTTGVVFNNIYELRGLIANEQYYPADALPDAQKDYVDSLVKKAYDNWSQVVEYDGKSLLNIKQYKKSSFPRAGLLPAANNYSHPSDNQTLVPSFPVEAPAMEHNILSGGSSYFSQPQQLIPPNPPRSHYYFPAYPESNQQINHPNREGVDLSLSSFQINSQSLHHTNANPFEDWSTNPNTGMDELLSEEEIRMRTHEILENEDMQHMLRLLSMGGHSSTEDDYGSPSYMTYPTPGVSYNRDATRSGKAVAGWIKIKAAMRWGIFVRRKAAEKRAQLELLDDE